MESGQRAGMRYQLRRAAGRYWLLDMEQEGVPYRRPLCMNEMGAAVWELLVRGLDREGIVEELCRGQGRRLLPMWNSFWDSLKDRG